MVRVKTAFTLIELIFAIVVISITVISLPMMNNVISKGVEKSIVQEAIFSAATILQETTTAHWDTHSMESIYSLAKVIDIKGDCENNASLITYRKRPGHIAQPLHRTCLESNAVTTDNNTTTNQSVFVNTSSNRASGYKTDYNATVDITRPALFNGSNNTNMKKITISIKDGNSIITSLHTYTANIGEIDYYKKGY